jgi:hypothetical protein
MLPTCVTHGSERHIWQAATTNVPGCISTLHCIMSGPGRCISRPCGMCGSFKAMHCQCLGCAVYHTSSRLPRSQARCGNPPDVWMQLQHHLQEVDEPAGPAGVGQAPAGPVGQASTGPVGQAPAGLVGLDQAPIGPVGQAPTGPVGQAHVGPVGPADLGQALTSTVGQVPAGLGKALPKRRTKPVAAPGP